MSIRLRLTVLYSTILALTLFVFSALLYVMQSQATFNGIRDNLVRQAEGPANVERRFPRPPDPVGSNQQLPGRWTQLLNPDGTIFGRTADLSDVKLPLSDEGLRVVQNGKTWIESATVDGDPLLIYSQPILAQNQVTRIIQVAAPVTEREQSLATLRLLLIVGSSFALVAAVIIGWGLAGAALSPIHRITQTAQVIGAERDFSRRVQHTGPNDEVGQLAVTFNDMLTELESSYHHVEEALQAQRRFVADASHELRTPLTTVRGNIELLRHEPPMEAREQADVLADTKEEVERLIRLVNQLLMLARADAGRSLRVEPITIAPLVEDVCRQVKLIAPQRTISYDLPNGTAVLANSDALKQVLLILLDNARIHTPANSTISVSTTIADQRVAIHVHDTGPGIKPSALPHIFERFYRGDVSRSAGGTGLGLSIAKDLVEAQKGELTVASQLGDGSTFTLVLPQATT
jgi:two-component system, OmpR family, sensor kinase